jgi:hypothetical protein
MLFAGLPIIDACLRCRRSRRECLLIGEPLTVGGPDHGICSHCVADLDRAAEEAERKALTQSPPEFYSQNVLKFGHNRRFSGANYFRPTERTDDRRRRGMKHGQLLNEGG